MRPLILISPDERPSSDGRPYYYLRRSYGLAVAAAGGAPLMAADPACFSEYAEICSGLILSDGIKLLSPGRYGRTSEDIPGLSPFELPVSVARDSRELCLCEAFLRAKKPVLGIGRGMHVINVLLGGTLKTAKSDGHPDAMTHMTAVPGSVLRRLMGESFEALCCARQQTDRPGRGLVPSVFGEKGAVMGFEHEELPVFGVQWHPEPLAGDLELYRLNRDKDEARPIPEEEMKASRARAVTKKPDPAFPGDLEAAFSDPGPLFTYFVSLCEGGLHG